MCSYCILYVGPQEGVIGTVFDDNMEYTSDNSQFFLNLGAAASTSGTVSRVRYCFTLQASTTVTIYQATVGFYRRSIGNTLTLSNSFNITKSAASAPVSMFQCETLSISTVEVSEGDLIGVCSRESPTIGRVILAANTVSDVNNIIVLQNVSSDRLCNQERGVPQMFQTEQVTDIVLLLYANISTCKVIQVVITIAKN